MKHCLAFLLTTAGIAIVVAPITANDGAASEKPWLDLVPAQEASRLRPAQTTTVLMAKRLIRPYETVKDPATMFEEKIVLGALCPEGAIHDIKLVKPLFVIRRLQAGDIVTTDHIWDGIGCEYGPGPPTPRKGPREFGVRVSADQDVRPKTRVNVVVISDQDGARRTVVSGVLVVETDVYPEMKVQYVTLSVRLDDVLPLVLAEANGRIHLEPVAERK